MHETNLFLIQHDNKVANFEFHVSTDGQEINYSELEKALLVIYYQDESTLEPIVCDIKSNYISFCACEDILGRTGTITGFLRLYSTDKQVITTSIFRYTVDKDLISRTVSPTDISLLNQAMSRLATIEFEEKKRSTAETNRVSEENKRKANEVERINAEIKRIDDFNQMKTEFQALQDGINLTPHSIVKNYYSAVGSSLNQTDTIIVPPSGYNMELLSATLVSKGNAVGLASDKTFKIELKCNNVVNSTFTFNDTNSFPSEKNKQILPISVSAIDESYSLDLILTNTDTVTIPDFTIQVDYKLTKLS